MTAPPRDPIAALRELVEAAISELGVPGPGYAQPVANAYDILIEARSTLEAVEGGERGGLGFGDLNAANVARAKRWHPGFPADDDWNLADWSNAMCGEVGELANVVKKLRRHQTSKLGALDKPADGLKQDAADEMADVVIYADLLAAKLGISLGAAIVSKFNEVSERQGFPERLPDNQGADDGRP